MFEKDHMLIYIYIHTYIYIYIIYIYSFIYVDVIWYVMISWLVHPRRGTRMIYDHQLRVSVYRKIASQQWVSVSAGVGLCLLCGCLDHHRSWNSPPADWTGIRLLGSSWTKDLGGCFKRQSLTMNQMLHTMMIHDLNWFNGFYHGTLGPLGL